MHINRSNGSNLKNGPSSDSILNRINATRLNIGETSINSAAFQDHIMQSYNLGCLDPFKQKQKSIKRPSYMSKYAKKKPGVGGRTLSNAGQNIIRTDSASSAVSVPKSHSGLPRKFSSHSNSKYSNREEEKVMGKKSEVYRTKNLIDKLNSETYINIEKKREEYVHKLTLAQRRGLVARPPMPLSQAQWKGIETKGTTRIDNNDFCSICLEKFRIESQTILSCSHVFHTK